MSHKLKHSLATILSIVLVVSLLPLGSFVRADSEQGVYYIFEYYDDQDEYYHFCVEKELADNSILLGIYVNGGSYEYQEGDGFVIANNATIYASPEMILDDVFTYYMAGDSIISTEGFIVYSDNEEYSGELSYDALEQYCNDYSSANTLEFTNDYVFDSSDFYYLDDFENIIVPEDVTVMLASCEKHGQLKGSYLNVKNLVVNGCFFIEGVSSEMIGLNELYIGSQGSLVIGDTGEIIGGHGACISPESDVAATNFTTYKYDFSQENVIEVTSGDFDRVVYDEVWEKWIVSNTLAISGWFNATYKDFGRGSLLTADGCPIADSQYYTFEPGSEITFTITVPEERLGEALEVGIVFEEKNGITPELYQISESEYIFQYTPENSDGFSVWIIWSDFDVYTYDDEHFFVEIDCAGSLDFDITPAGEVYEEPHNPKHVRVTYENEAINDGIKVTITPKAGHSIASIFFNWNYYEIFELSEVDGLEFENGVLTVNLNKNNYDDSHNIIEIKADDYEGDSGQETETGSFVVDYIPSWDYDMNPLAYVEVNGEIVDTCCPIDFEAGEELVFTIHAPEDRAGLERFVQIIADDRTYYHSNLPYSSNSNLVVEDDQFTFTPPDNRNFYVVVDWCEYDYYRGEKHLLLVETEACGDGSIRVEKEEFNMADPANPNHIKHVVPTFNVSEENPVRVYFTPSKDAELTAVNIRIDNDHMVTYVPEWNEWYQDANLMSEDSHFEMVNGIWTYKITEKNEEKRVYEFIVNFETPEQPETGNITVISGDVGVQYAFVKDGIQGSFTDLEDEIILDPEDIADQVILKFIPAEGETLPSVRIQRTIMGAIMNPLITSVNDDNTVVLDKGDYFWGTWTVEFADGSEISPYEFMIKAVGSEDYDPLENYETDVIYGYYEDDVIELDFGEETPYMVVVYPNWGEEITLEMSSDGKYYYAPEMLEGFLIKVFEDQDAYEFDAVSAGEGETEFMFRMFFEGYPENQIPASKVSMLSRVKNTAFSSDGSKVKVVVSDDLESFSWKITLGDEAFNYVVMLDGHDITGQAVNNDGILTVDKSVFEDDMDLTITINYRKTYEITAEYNEGGSVSVPETAQEGRTVKVTATPFEGYVIDAIKVNDEVITGDEFVMPSKDVKVDVVFRRLAYTVTLNEVFGGTASVSATSAKPGDEILITYEPAEGYDFVSIKVDGEVIEGNKFIMPSKDVVVDIVFEKKAEPVKNGWIIEDGKYYYYDNGNLKTGWVSSGSSWYYMNPEDGSMVTGWKNIGGRWYYFASSGAMVSGWQSIGGKWYYFDNSGAMATGWKSVGNTWYYFTSSGAMVTGWQSIGGSWYYFESSGAMATGWKSSGGKWYYFNNSGAMVSGWQSIGGTWYYFDTSGAMITGWKSIGGTWYYFNGGGDMVTGWKQISGKWYYFYNSGAMASNTVIDGWKLGSDGAWTG